MISMRFNGLRGPFLSCAAAALIAGCTASDKSAGPSDDGSGAAVAPASGEGRDSPAVPVIGDGERGVRTAAQGNPGVSPPPHPIADFVAKGIEWIVKAQHPDGGWGSGSHANQQLRDPHQVVTDPATTAFAAMALLRAGHTPLAGEYREAVRRATEHLCGVVEEAPADGPKITGITGTQPQAKMGQLVDTSMAAQFFARLLPALPEGDALHKRVDAALEKCLGKLQVSQQQDGSWGSGGWAPVLQSSFGCSALEMAQAAGKRVDQSLLDNARQYQKRNFDTATGKADAAASAGVELYAFAGAQRGNASDVRTARDAIAMAKKEGKLSREAPVSEENLRIAGLDEQTAASLAQANQQSEAQLARLDDEAMLRGFGNNGGEEYVSYMLTSESLVIQGDEAWEKWNDKMLGMLAKIQSPDGSWTGHHCITSPVFCTAAVVQCLTADREAPLLRKIGGGNLAAK